MRYVEAPESFEPDGSVSVFLAGGISGCPDWQRVIRYALRNSDLTLVNPRRAAFDLEDGGVAEEQIVWEHDALRACDIIAFWFPCETLCPITLYELGAWSMTDKPLIVGAHPDYARRFDILVQTALQRPGVRVVDSLDEYIWQIERMAPRIRPRVK